jgi:Kef-type K+ transport system membrane component KefB
MEHATTVILIASAAFVLPLVASRMRMPAVVLEILFGIVVGPAILGWIHESEVVAYLAEVGFFLLMFLSGFEIDFRQLERQGVPQIAVGLAVFGLTLFLAFHAGRMLGHGPFVTLVLATTSVGLVVPTLRGGGWTPTRLGQAILIAALLADFLTLIGATLFALVEEHGYGPELLNFPVLFLVIAVVLFGLRRLSWWFPEKFERLFDPRDPQELGIRMCLAFMFVFVGLASLLGIEAILGAFLAGTVFAMVFRHRGVLEQKLNGFSYGFLVPIFFIHVGTRFDLDALLEPGVVVAAVQLIVAAILIKVVAAVPLLLRGLTVRETLAAGVLLSTRLSLVIAVAELGARLGFLDRRLESEVILLAVVTSTLSPVLFRWIAPAARNTAPIRSDSPAA